MDQTLTEAPDPTKWKQSSRLCLLRQLNSRSTMEYFLVNFREKNEGGVCEKVNAPALTHFSCAQSLCYGTMQYPIMR